MHEQYLEDDISHNTPMIAISEWQECNEHWYWSTLIKDLEYENKLRKCLMSLDSKLRREIYFRK